MNWVSFKSSNSVHLAHMQQIEVLKSSNLHWVKYFSNWRHQIYYTAREPWWRFFVCLFLYNPCYSTRLSSSFNIYVNTTSKLFLSYRFTIWTENMKLFVCIQGLVYFPLRSLSLVLLPWKHKNLVTYPVHLHSWMVISATVLWHLCCCFMENNNRV